jgi:polyhydroxybutyrate depolymerase
VRRTQSAGRRAVIVLATLLTLAAMTAACSSSSSTATPPSTSAPSSTTSTTSTTGNTGGIAYVPPGSSIHNANAVSSGCGRPHTAGQSTQSFTFEGKSRTYELYVPHSYEGTRPVPVVFNFHGWDSNAIEQMIYADFRPLAEQHDFVIVAPNGQVTSFGQHFNLTGEPGLQNDVTMVLSLLDHIESTFCIDTHRIYSTGMSDGGAMSSVLACVASNRFAAFGPVAVVVYPSNCLDHSVAIESFKGTADPIVPYNGARVNCCGHPTIAPAPTAMAQWANHNQCSPTPSEARLGSEVRRQTWTGCRAASAVVYYIIDGGGHTWPGSFPLPGLGLVTSQVNATSTLWAFFAAHPLQPT